MRSILLTLPVLLLANCTTMTSQSDILAKAKAEVSAREAWSDQAIIRVASSPGYDRLTWKVTAGVLDQSDFPRYNGIKVVPGTEREMSFTAMGCLISYGQPGPCCARRYQAYQKLPPEPIIDK